MLYEVITLFPPSLTLLLPILLSLTIVLSPTIVHALGEASAGYLEELIAQTRLQKLADEREWRNNFV